MLGCMQTNDLLRILQFLSPSPSSHIVPLPYGILILSLASQATSLHGIRVWGLANSSASSSSKTRTRCFKTSVIVVVPPHNRSKKSRQTRWIHKCNYASWSYRMKEYLQSRVLVVHCRGASGEACCNQPQHRDMGARSQPCDVLSSYMCARPPIELHSMCRFPEISNGGSRRAQELEALTSAGVE